MPRSIVLFIIMTASSALSQTKPRARDLGVPFDGKPGPFNAITDVKGVEVGHTTLISGSGKLKVGEGPVRTGVTAVLPRGKDSLDPVFGAWFTLNGNGEMTGTTWLEDSGVLDGPIMITNTHSVGVVRDAVIAWRIKRAPPDRRVTTGPFRSSPRLGMATSTTPTVSMSNPSMPGMRSTPLTAVRSRKVV